MRETACKLDDHIAGIVTVPATPRRALVLVNAGVVPKHGPFRLYAELARRVAGTGYTTLRFDLGGLGDSAADTSGAPLVARTAGEIGAAVDHLAATGHHDRIVVGGLCSGAEDAYRYAERDPRITGVVLIDPFAYRTPGFYPRDVVRRATGRALRAVGAWQPLALHGHRLVDYRYMPRRESARILAALVSRRVRVHFVYTGGSADVFNYAGQLAAMFRGVDFHDRVTVDHLPGIEHTQMLADDRAQLVDAIGARLAAW